MHRATPNTPMIRTLRPLLLSALVLAACAPPATVGANAEGEVSTASADAGSGVALQNEAAAVRMMDLHYDPLMRDAGITGRVVVDVLLQADGGVRESRVVSSTNDRFTGPGTRVARTLRFTPPAEAGAVVRVRMEFIYRRGEIAIVR